MTARPSRPRDAASLIIVRGRGRGASVLLGRREPRSRFMPSVYVFPGGRVDRSDVVAPVDSELPSAVRQKLRHQGGAHRIRALGVAALRETYEETGLTFGRLVEGRLHPELDGIDYLGRAITPTSSAIRYHARFFVARASRARGELIGNGELLDLRWYRIREALALPIIDVTQYMLHEVRERLAEGGPVSAPSKRPSLFVHYRNEDLRLGHEP